jgi:hypothetical protein
MEQAVSKAILPEEEQGGGHDLQGQQGHMCSHRPDLTRTRACVKVRGAPSIGNLIKET